MLYILVLQIYGEKIKVRFIVHYKHIRLLFSIRYNFEICLESGFFLERYGLS